MPTPPELTTLSCIVDPYRSGWFLLDFLTHKFRYLPHHLWEERLLAGRVRVNGERVRPFHRVAAGDRISYTIEIAEPEVDLRYEVVHEDEDCLAVCKSGNLPVHAGGRYIRNTLIAHLRSLRTPEEAAALVLAHRLDRETSGIVLLAKHRGAAAHFEREFRAGRVSKSYLAILRGTVFFDLVVDAPIGRAPETDPDPPRWRILPEPAGRPSVTRFEPLPPNFARVASGVAGTVPSAGDAAPVAATLVRAIPESGRTHQIRLHAAHVGHPILGDKIHGLPTALVREYFESGETAALVSAAGAPRQMLHAERLEISSPSGKTLQLFAPLPPDFALS